MRKIYMTVFSLLAVTQLSAQSQQELFAGLHKIAGTWSMDTKKGKLYEHWKMVAADELAGVSYRLNGADTTILERMRLVSNDQGMYFIPVVTGQNNNEAVEFKLISAQNGVYTFENKAHDFPQRVIYRLDGNDQLFGRIEGERQGKIASSDFPYKRVN